MTKEIVSSLIFIQIKSQNKSVISKILEEKEKNEKLIMGK